MGNSVFVRSIWIYLLFRCSNIDAVCTKDEQQTILTQMMIECFVKMNETIHTVNVTDDGLFCPMLWDNVMCWPQTPAGTVKHQPCPSYIMGFAGTDSNSRAFRECLPNGTWSDPRDPNNGVNPYGWTNFSLCLDTAKHNCSKREIGPTSGNGVPALVQQYMQAFRMTYIVGYVLSLISLLCAGFVMVYFRKLHCARNYIHLNLFVAFLLRASLSLVRENVWVQHLGFPKDVRITANGTVDFTEGPHWECRLFFTFYQYVLMSSYMWIFMEAVYIHMVIFVNVFSEKIQVKWYMILGWTLPLPFVISWSISRVFLDNEYCWQFSIKSPGLKWFLTVPVLITVVMNFLFFVNIVRVLLTKLNTFPNSDTNRYRTLAKSVVVLIPLFGVYFILVAVPIEHVDDKTSFVLLFIEMFFNSYQGLFIALLLCFINAEVRGEIKKSWNRMYLRRLSNVSRASQLCPTQTSRSMSTTRLSDASRHVALRKYHTGRSSVTDIEQTVPFTNTLVNVEQNNTKTECDKRDNETMENKLDTASESLLENGHVTFSQDGKVALKINVVNIECKSRDGLSTHTTSLGIQAVKNGLMISEENILNNNVAEEGHRRTEKRQSDNRQGENKQTEQEEGIAFADESV